LPKKSKINGKLGNLLIKAAIKVKTGEKKKKMISPHINENTTTILF
jgi:hypothetical protein